MKILYRIAGDFARMNLEFHDPKLRDTLPVAREVYNDLCEAKKMASWAIQYDWKMKLPNGGLSPVISIKKFYVNDGVEKYVSTFYVNQNEN